jgi:hypothetical protein
MLNYNAGFPLNWFAAHPWRPRGEYWFYISSLLIVKAKRKQLLITRSRPQLKTTSNSSSQQEEFRFFNSPAGPYSSAKPFRRPSSVLRLAQNASSNNDRTCLNRRSLGIGGRDAILELSLGFRFLASSSDIRSRAWSSEYHSATRLTKSPLSRKALRTMFTIRCCGGWLNDRRASRSSSKSAPIRRSLAANLLENQQTYSMMIVRKTLSLQACSKTRSPVVSCPINGSLMRTPRLVTEAIT